MKKLWLDNEKIKKLDNFWYYYKFHVLGGIFVLFCIGTFVKDIMSKIDYDYNIAFVGDYGILQEDSEKLQLWFEKNAEDLNGDGEIHVQIADYAMSDEVGPQMLMASQTKFMADMQEGASMICFLSQENLERYKGQGIFPEDAEKFAAMKECRGFKETGSPVSVQDLSGTIRLVEKDSRIGKSEEKQKYYEASEKLLKKFIGE